MPEFVRRFKFKVSNGKQQLQAFLKRLGARLSRFILVQQPIPPMLSSFMELYLIHSKEISLVLDGNSVKNSELKHI